MIIEFLLARKKDSLRFIVTNIMITHFFVHPSQLKDKKGSCLAPFVEIIKNIGFGLELQWDHFCINLHMIKTINSLWETIDKLASDHQI